MNTSLNKSVAIWNCGIVAKSLTKIVKAISADQNTISIICSTEYDKRSVESKLKGTAAIVVTISDVFDEYKKQGDSLNNDRVMKLSEENEIKYGVNMVEIISADRHIGRGFVKGAWYPRSTLSENITYIESLNIINGLFDFFDKFFSKSKIDVLLLEVASISPKVACVVARSHKVEVRIPHPSRVDKGYFFSKNEFIEYPDWSSSYKENLEKINKHKEPDLRIKGESYYLAKSEIIGYLQYGSLINTIKKIITQFVTYFYRKLKGYRKYTEYYFTDKVRAIWRYHRGIVKAQNKTYIKHSSFLNKNYVLLPLQLEPESSMMVMTPEFNNQLYLIHLIASNMPASWTLVVKEHPLALGVRPSGFMTGIESYPNVCFASPFDNTKEWYKRSQAVATINSTVGYDAAFDGVPVLSFGKYNFISILDHVYYVNTSKSIFSAFNAIKKNKFDIEQRRIQGFSLYETIKNNAFLLDARAFLSGNAKDVDIEIFASNFIKSYE
jgi:hypothetical protein